MPNLHDGTGLLAGISEDKIADAEGLIAGWFRIDSLIKSTVDVEVTHDQRLTDLILPKGPLHTLNTVEFFDNDYTAEVKVASAFPKWVLQRTSNVRWPACEPILINMDVGFEEAAIPNNLTLAVKLIATNFVSGAQIGALKEIALRDLAGKLYSPQESALIQNYQLLVAYLRPFFPPPMWCGTMSQIIAGIALEPA